MVNDVRTERNEMKHINNEAWTKENKMKLKQYVDCVTS